MGDLISTDGWNLPRLADDWARAKPFPHLVFDELLSPGPFAELQLAASNEPLVFLADEIYQHRGSAEPPANPLLRAFEQELASPRIREALREITGLATSRVSMRAYRYDRGDFLLPHTDWRPGEERLLAFAYYLGTPGGERLAADKPLRGGELELYDCVLEGKTDEEAIVQTRSARLIPASANRIALFHVGPRALHRVREVTRGSRLSLAGWFL